MKTMDWLRKLGIVRYGVKTGTYTSGKDRPIELMMDDVYDAKKDLTTKEDLKAMFGKTPAVPPAVPPLPVVPVPPAATVTPSACFKCGVATQSGARFCTACGASLDQPATPVCAGCKAPLREGARFCILCGSPVAAWSAAPVPPPPPPAAVPVVASPAVPVGRGSNLMPMVLAAVGIVGFLILVVVLVAAASRSRSPDTGTAKVEEALNREAAAVGKAIRNLEKQVEQAVPREAAVKPEAPKAAAPERPVATREKAVQTPQAGEPAPAGTGTMQYDLYRNPKFGFAAELPAHWESSVRNNAHLFSGAKGTDQYDTTVNFQFITKGSATIRNQADDILNQWKTMDDFDLDDIRQGQLDGHDMLFMVARFRVSGGALFRQKQVIIDRAPYYYMIAYTAPAELYPKYEYVMAHLLETFRFTEPGAN